jgi:hypothetical protein
VRILFLHIQNDLTWGNVDSGTWSMIELTSGIVCANLATMRPLLRKAFPWLGGGTTAKSSAAEASEAVNSAGWQRTSSRSKESAPGSVVDEVEMQGGGWKLNGKASQDYILPAR